MAPIPIVLCGKYPDMCDEFIKRMLPEYDIVHVCHNTPVALYEIVPLLMGQSLQPCSGQGSNARSKEAKIPKAIFVGGGFAEYELQQMRLNEVIRSVPMLYPPPGKRPEGQTNEPPPIDKIVARTKEAFAKHDLVEGKEDHIKPGLWEF